MYPTKTLVNQNKINIAGESRGTSGVKSKAGSSEAEGLHKDALKCC